MQDALPPSPASAEVQGVLAEVLSRPEYQPPEPSLLFAWLSSAGAWLRERLWALLQRLLPDFDLAGPVWGALARIALGVGALLGLALVVFLLVLAARAWRRRTRRARAGPEDGVGSRPLGAADWERRAHAAAERGEWREAALALYHAVLIRLGEAGAVRTDAAKTPGDYRREARRHDPELGSRVEIFLRGFERIAYGRAGAGGGDFDRLSRAAAALGLGG